MLAMFLLAGCGGGAVLSGVTQSTAANPAHKDCEPAASQAERAQLAGPKALQAVYEPSSGSNVAGAQYEPAWPHQRVSVSGTAARFTPSSGSQAGLDGLAYAIYRLDLAAITPNGQLAFTWDAAPEAGQLWLALPDFKHDRWKWYAVDDPAGIKLPGWNLYLTDFGELYVLVAVSGTASATLAQLSMGSLTPVVEGGWRFERGNPQRSNCSEFAGPAPGTHAWMIECNPVSAPLVSSTGLCCFLTNVGGWGEGQWKLQVNCYNADGTLHNAFRSIGNLLGITSNNLLYFWCESKDETGDYQYSLKALVPSGATQWEVHFADADNWPFFALGPDDACYLGFQGLLYCINPDGTQRWVVKQDDLWDSPAVFLHDGTLIVQASDTKLIGYDHRGQIVLAIDRPSAYTYELLVGPDDTLYWYQDHHRLIAWQIGAGLRWEYQTGSYISDLAIGADSSVYMIVDYRVLALDPNGHVRWEITGPMLPGAIKTTTALTVDANGNVYTTNDWSPFVIVLNRDGAVITYIDLRDAFPEDPSYQMAPQRLCFPAPGVLLVEHSHGISCIRQEPDMLYSPVNLQASDGTASGSVGLIWEYPDGAQPEGYRVYRATESDGDYTLIGEVGTGTSYTDATAGSQDVYFYKVSAFLGTEESEPSWEDAGYIHEAALPDDWRMFGGGPRHTHYSTATGPISATTVRRTQLYKNDSITTNPALCRDGVAYYGTGNGLLVAVTRAGDTLWEFQAQGAIYATPALGEDGTVYFGDETGACYALNPAGELQWFCDISTGSLASPLRGPDGIVYFGSRDGNLYALNPGGSLRWQFAAGEPIETAPALGADGTLYFGCNDGSIYAVTATGGEAWHYATGDPACSSPAAGADGTIYSGSHAGKLYALSPSGNLDWVYTTSGMIVTSPAIAGDGAVCCGSSDGSLYMLNPDGSLRWSFAAGGTILSSPVLDGTGTAYCGTEQGELYAVSVDGLPLWQLDCQAPMQTSPALDRAGSLYCAGANGWIWRIPTS